ncbi:MAG: hypothetical protein GPOALKHO_001502 [Sodalis sp.]|nr:MAG: hypothetical protein GPOALKHO_001502 [Sodalis sp.]
MACKSRLVSDDILNVWIMGIIVLPFNMLNDLI